MSVSEDTSRIFMALPLVDDVRTTLVERCEEMRQVLPFRKWVHPQDLHITVQFLGETRNDVAEKCSTALADRLQQFDPFMLRLAGLGFFGRPTAPRIFWAGLHGDVKQLQQLYTAVTEVTSPFGFIKEDRPYRPHITLAKNYKGEAALDETLLNHHSEALLSPEWQVSEAVMYRTHMKSSPMYEIVAKFPFRALSL